MTITFPWMSCLCSKYEALTKSSQAFQEEIEERERHLTLQTLITLVSTNYSNTGPSEL